MSSIATLILFGYILTLGAAEVQFSRPPRLTPSEEEHVFRTGGSFELICEAAKPINWKLPKLSHHLANAHDVSERATITQLDQVTDGYRYRSKLQVVDIGYRDTGYYACYHEGSEDTDNARVVAKTYVYVEDDQHLIVNGDEDTVTVVVHQSAREVIPCKPTSPSVEMTLVDVNGDSINTSGGDADFDAGEPTWSYDSRQGFIMEDVSLEMSGLYDCKARHLVTGLEQLISYYITVLPATTGAPKPFINQTLASQVALGQSFQLNCSASFDQGVTAELKWFVPNPNGIDGDRIRTGRLTSFNGNVAGMEQKIVFLVLYVDSSRAEDEGHYECRASDHTHKFETDQVFVKIHGQDTAYVNISDSGLHPYLEESANDTLKWVVNFEAYPNPTVVWYKDNEPHFDKRDIRYTVKTEQKKTVLEINYARLSDSAVYRVVITASRAQDSRNFTLRIKDKPSVSAYVKPVRYGVIRSDERFEVACLVEAFPAPSVITVLFRECPPQKDCSPAWSPIWNQTSAVLFPHTLKENSRNDEIVDASHEDFRTQKVLVKGKARVSGQYSCKSCNPIGCNHPDDPEIKAKLFVTELSERAKEKNGLELVKSHVEPVAGESFKLMCGVSLYNFTRQLTWTYTNGTGKPITITASQLPSGTRMLKPERTYSYVEELVWDKVDMKASGTYSCRANQLQASSNPNTVVSTSFTVRDARVPALVNTSETQVTIDQYRELSLFCVAHGLPVPTVEWIKDGTLVTEDVIDLGVNGSMLSVQHAKASDSGEYICRYTNLAGSTEQSFQVEVVEPAVGTGIIIAIVLVIVVVIVLLVVLARRIYLDRKRKAFFRANQLDIFDKGNPESINPDLPIDEQTELLPYDRRWEFPRDRLKLGRQLGAGAFGRVLKGEAVGIDPAEAVTIVAVKMVRSHGNMIGLKALMSELKIMIHMGSHLNVVNLLGACTKHVAKGELLVIVEYCRYGNIQNYLIRHRSNFINQVDPRGYIDPNVGADKLAQAAAEAQQLGYQVPRSPLGTMPPHLNPYVGSPSPTGATEQSFLSMSPTGGGTGQTDLLDSMLDSNGHPVLTSAPSNSSNQPNSPVYPPWRSNYRGDYQDEPSQQPLCTRDLLCWAFQIARGMDYLARRKILHGDLAARNVLLADDNIVKIADFGLAREVYRSGNYKKKGEGPLPVKWMAIESIMDRVFSTQSDVWSFGIVLWELFSLGKTPYPGMDADEQFFIKLQDGYRMDRPKYAPKKVYEVMMECWARDPLVRPDFAALSEMLGNQLESSVRRHYMDLNDSYVQSHQIANGQGPDYLDMVSPPDYVNVGGRPSPRPPRHSSSPSAYVNVPNNGIEDPNRQSDYLAMGQDSTTRSSVPGSAGGAAYLFMTSPAPSTGSNGGGQTQFDFNFAPKLRKTDQNEAMDSVEMKPMLNCNTPSPTPAMITAFSNPNYQNPPSFSPTTLKSSDLDDLPPEYSTPPSTARPVTPVKSAEVPKQHYVNVQQQSAVKEEDEHYVNPKSNARVV